MARTNKMVKYSRYKKPLMRKALRFVFNTVKFDSPYLECLVYDSYLWNLDLMLRYACDNNIDPMSYILSIRDELLKSAGVHEYEYR